MRVCCLIFGSHVLLCSGHVLAHPPDGVTLVVPDRQLHSFYKWMIPTNAVQLNRREELMCEVPESWYSASKTFSDCPSP